MPKYFFIYPVIDSNLKNLSISLVNKISVFPKHLQRKFPVLEFCRLHLQDDAHRMM